jgi:PAS domain S-box-containing protein
MAAPAAYPADFTPALLADVLAVSLTALTLLRPVYDPTGSTIVNFVVEYLNPAAQRITGLGERPGVTMQARFPETFRNGVFAWYRGVFETGEAGQHDFNYQADGFDNYFQLAARRSGELLVVSFTDTADQIPTPVEIVLRESQAAEQAARAEAEAQRQRFYEVLLALPAQIATYHGPDHVYHFVTPRYQQYFGTQTLLGRSVRETNPEVGEQGIFALMDRVYQTGEPFTGRELEVWVDFTGTGQREQVFLNVCMYPLRDAQGHIDGLLDFSYDVTEQVRARQQVEQLNQDLETRVAERTAQVAAAAQRQARERETFTQIFAHTPAAICIQRGPTHRYEYVNAAYAQFFPGRMLLGLPVAEALPETVDAGLVALLDTVYRTGETYFGHEFPLLVAQPNGQPPRQMHFTFTYQAYRENGEIVGISTLAFDVAEQVQVRQAQQRVLREVFEQAPVAIAIFRGPRYLIELANPAVCALYGRTPAQALGTPLFDLLPEAAGQGFEELLDGVLATGVPYVAQELPSFIDRHGQRQTVYWDFVYQPLREADGAITGIMVVATDVSEQVYARQRVQALNEELGKTNDQLSVTNDRLMRTNVDLDNFIYTASHDLRAPITNVEGLLLALREHLAPADERPDALVHHLLELMQDSVARFQFTIAQLTDIARLQQAHDQPAEEVVVAAVVEAVRLDLAPQLAQTQAQLTVAVATDLRLSWAPKNLRSIIYNLLSNALKYHHPHRVPVVHLRAARQDDYVLLEVQDNGLGLTPQQQGKLFGLFRRLHTHVEGTGVGLYIVKRIVENGGGTITVRSQPDVGTTFCVTFPAEARILG